jgi:hypothetical protein
MHLAMDVPRPEYVPASHAAGKTLLRSNALLENALVGKDAPSQQPVLHLPIVPTSSVLLLD